MTEIERIYTVSYIIYRVIGLQTCMKMYGAITFEPRGCMQQNGYHSASFFILSPLESLLTDFEHFYFSLFSLYISYINPAQFLVILPRGPLLCQHVVRTLQKWFGHLSHMSSSRIYVHYEWFDPLVQKLLHFEKNKRLRLADHIMVILLILLPGIIIFIIYMVHDLITI